MEKINYVIGVLILIGILLAMGGCEAPVPLYGQLKVSFNLSKMTRAEIDDFTKVVSGKVFLKQDAIVRYEADIEIIDHIPQNCTLADVIYGRYVIVVEFYNGEQEIAYSSDEETITIDQPENGPVNLILKKYIGTLVIGGNWTEDIPDLQTGSAELKQDGNTKYSASLALDTEEKTVYGFIGNIYPGDYVLYIEIKDSYQTPILTGNEEIKIKKGENEVNLIFNPQTGTIEIVVNGDVTAPVILSGPDASVSGEDVTITWTTNEPATSLICYSETQGFNYQTQTTWAPPGGDMSADHTNHSVIIHGLTEGNTYYYIVFTADASGNTRVSDEESFVLAEYWARTFGGSGDDTGIRIILDNFDNVCTMGMFHDSVDFNPGIGIANKTAPTNTSIFTVKFNANGDYIWVNAIGSSSENYYWRTCGLGVDSSSNIYIGNYFNSTVDFDPTDNSDFITPLGYYDFFWSKYGTSGSYEWTKRIEDNGGSGEILSIFVDGSNHKYISGCFDGTFDFNPGSGIDSKTSVNGQNIFICEYDENDDYISTFIMPATAVPGYQQANVIKTDINNNLYISGSFEYGIDLNPFGGEDNYTSSMGGNAFITKLNSNDTYAWSRVMGGSGIDCTFDFIIDSTGNIYTVSTVTLTYGGYSWMVLEKLNPDGSVAWTRENQTPGSFCRAYGIASINNNLYVIGNYSGTIDFDPTGGTDNKTSAGSQDCFISKYATDGTYFWTRTFGATGDDTLIDIIADSVGNLYLCGYYEGIIDFDLGLGIDNRTSNGARDAFVMKIPAAMLEN